MTSIINFGQHLGQKVTGQYRVTGVQRGFNEKIQRESLRIKIGDYTSEASLIAPAHCASQTTDLAIGDIVWAEIQPRELDYVQGGTLRAVRKLYPDEIGNVAYLFPKSDCPQSTHDSLPSMVDLIERITQEPLREFINNLLNRNYSNYCRAMGGWEYHHDYPGGLLVHSLNTALEAERQATTVFGQDKPRVEIITVAALIHDLGKAVQIHKGLSPSVVCSIPHTTLTLCLCIDDLNRLDANWHEGAKHLTEILIQLCLGPKDRKFGHDAEIVHMADVLDVKCFRAQQGSSALMASTETHSISAALSG